MKKFFISTAILAMAFAASAQRTEGGDNLVVNGSFDAEGLEQAIPGEWGWPPMNECRNISVLPGWEVSTGGVWNGGIEVMDDPLLDAGDGDLRAEEDYQWLRMFSDTDNMWTAITATQKVTGLEVGKSYKLDFVICGKPYATVGEGEGSWDSNLTVNVILAEVDGDKLGKEVKNLELTRDDIEQDWTRQTVDFTASATEMYIKLSMGNWLPDKPDAHDQAWVGFDCIDIYDPNGTPAGVADVVVEENAPVEYFNLQGIRVANPENGVFIRRQGDKAVKVAL